MENTKTVLSWSSGKDAAFAYTLLKEKYGISVGGLITTLSEDHERVTMHGTREKLLDIQAERMKLPLSKVRLPSNTTEESYKEVMKNSLLQLKKQGIEAVAYGDIYLEDLRKYREQLLSDVGLEGVFPLWKMDTTTLVKSIEETGIEAIIVCVSEKYLGKEFLGKKLNHNTIQYFPANVDPCGENGEFHTLVYNAPFFTSPIPLNIGEVVYKNYGGLGNGAYFLDINV